MPNVFRYTLDKLDPILNKCLKFKIPMIALFPCLKNNKKDLDFEPKPLMKII